MSQRCVSLFDSEGDQYNVPYAEAEEFRDFVERITTHRNSGNFAEWVGRFEQYYEKYRVNHNSQHALFTQ